MLAPSITALSLEEPPSEAVFLQRELGVTWSTTSIGELSQAIASSKKTLLAISEPEHYEQLVSAAPDSSLILLLVSDEAFSPSRLKLASSPSVHRTYRNYPALPVSTRSITVTTVAFMRDAMGTSQSPRTAMPNISSGLKVRKRMKQWARLGDRARSIPLGYTDTFARSFVDRTNLSPESSLFEAEVAPGSRDISVSFRGNRGLAQRICGLDLASDVPHSAIELVDADWSARSAPDAGEQYVDLMISSRFALCPPGFVNNESFRFYEALACGALPIEVRVATTHLGVNELRASGSISEYSWKQGLGLSQTLTQAEIKARVDSARKAVRSSLDRLRLDIQADLGMNS